MKARISPLFQHIKRFVDVCGVKIMSDTMGTAALLAEPLTKTESKKRIKMVCKSKRYRLAN